MKNYTVPVLLAAAIAAVICLSTVQGPDDHQIEWDRSAALKELQASQSQSARRDKAALALCVQERGPGAVVLWTQDGDLVCRARPVRVAGGVK